MPLALIAMRIGERRGPTVRAPAARGRRCLTCYLAQSVVLATAYSAGFGGRLGLMTTTAARAVAAVTRLLTVGTADLMCRRQHRGPVELVFRRRTDGPPHAVRKR